MRDLVDILEQNYRLPPVRNLTRLTGGDKNLLYKLGGQDLVVKLCQPSAPLDGIAFERGLMALLSARMGCVARPLYTAQGEPYFLWEGRPVAVEAYLKGTTPTQTDRENPAFCFEAGRVLGQIHGIAAEHADQLPALTSRVSLAQMEPLRNHLLDWDKASRWLSATRFAPELPTMRGQLEALWGAVMKTLNGAALLPIHGDYYAGNLLWDGKKITGAVDFDDARYEWAAFEVARSLWEFARDDQALCLSEKRRDAYLDGYSSACPGVKHDMALYDTIIRLVRLLEILSTATSMVNGDLLGEFDGEYHWRNLLWCVSAFYPPSSSNRLRS